MDPTLAGFLGLFLFLALIFIGMHIAFAAALVGLVGLWVVAGSEPALTSVGILPHSITAKYVFTVLPLFIIMGHFAFFARFTQDVFWTGRQWVGWLPGGLASATVVGGAGFAAASGSSLAAAAVLTKVALPELEKNNYDRKLSAGSIAAVGTLAATIPPSALIVIYGIMTEQSIGKLLMAGFLPGFLTAVLFVLQITLRAWRNPSLGPAVHGVTWKERVASLKGVWGVVFLAGLVMGGIYSGIFTPTEAGAAGAAGALLIGVALRRLSRVNLGQALLDTGRTTGMVFIIIVGILIFVRFLAITRVPYDIGEFLAGLPVSPLVILIGILALYLVLGAFMDAIGMLLLTLPIIFPLSQALGFDPIWFGILVVIMCEIGLLTPPVGLNIYVVKGVAPHIPLEDMFRGVIPFVLTMFVVIALLIIFPQIALILPDTMR
jgi:tripartite ATP-independent transporter DctM subunit